MSAVERVTYTVGVYVATTWATGSLRGTRVREFMIEEEATVLGGMRAIDAAVDQCGGLDLCDVSSPTIEPNPGELGWPIGEPRRAS